ncbi:MAG TPA: NAD-dependent epimerase/dehydratase family protein [Methylomirabilota bacterium]|nr:NAD-dependent epimerase/dehydratase family protein [Methylomirabilota bacterium]
MKVLVTGGAGFVGSHVVDRLVADGHAVAVVDDLSTGQRENVNAAATLHVCDIRSRQLSHVVREVGPRAIVHLAAQAAVPRSVEDPQFDAAVNILGTINLLEAGRAAGTERVVYISTGGAAYGDTTNLPTPEDHPARAVSPYGVSKVTAERYLECWTGLSSMTGMSLRLANVYGPRQRADGEAGVVAIFAQRLLSGQRCRIYGDGEQTRDYIYVGDVAAAALSALTRDVAGVVNIATARETSVNTLHQRMCAALGVSSRPEYAPARPGDVRRSVLDNTRAGTVLEWVPRISLELGLTTTIESMRS